MKLIINGEEVDVPEAEEFEGVLITKMTADERESYLKSGCDPACHACFALIPEGEEYGYVQVLSAEDAASRGLTARPVHGMFCGACVRSRAELPPKEFEYMLARVKAGEQLDPPDLRKKALPPSPMPKGRGCFRVGGRILAG